jgi:hypothetical protein
MLLYFSQIIRKRSWPESPEEVPLYLISTYSYDMIHTPTILSLACQLERDLIILLVPD